MDKNQNTKLTTKTGVLIVQLGTPDDASPTAVRRFLREFLSDRYVVDTNRFLWFFILNFFVLPSRPKKSARLYKRLFDNHGPVLKTYTESVAKKIGNFFEKTQPSVFVRFGMRYGNPGLKKVLLELVEKENCEKILVVPLFPQYAQATLASIYDAVMEKALQCRVSPLLRFMPPFYKKEAWINSVSQVIQTALAGRKTPPERLIFSYHGIPQRHVQKGDPYEKMCHETTRLIQKTLNYPEDQTLHTYQSRFGREPWIGPATLGTIVNLAQNGVRDIMVVCPGFTIDCLETLDEIGVEARKHFLQNGGERFELLSCLNDSDLWVSALCGLIENELRGWI